DDVRQKYGAESLRLYVMFVAAPEKEIGGTDAGLEGSWRFLARVWRLADSLRDSIGGEGIPAPGTLELNDAQAALRGNTHQQMQVVRVLVRLAAHDPREDQARHRRSRSARPSEHGDLRDDGARQRALRLLQHQPVRPGRR